MRVVGLGVDMDVYGWELSESVWHYSSVLRVDSRAVLLGGGVYDFEGLGRWGVVSMRGVGGGLWRYECYPEAYLGMCGMLSRPVCGVYDLGELCGVLGLPYVSVLGGVGLVRHQWVLGSMRGVRLFSALRDGSGVSGGGCSCLWYGSGGKFVHSDLRSVVGGFGGGVVFEWSGGLSGAVGVSRDGGVDVCGSMDLCFDGEGGVGSYRRVDFGGDGFVGGWKGYLSNDSLESYREWCFRNRYWRSYYRGLVLEGVDVRVVGGVLGCGVLCERVCGVGVCERYVCVGYRSGGGVEGLKLSLDLVRV